MKIEEPYESDCETRMYATDPEWLVTIDGEPVQVGVYAQVENLYEAGLETMPEGYPLGISFSVVAHNPQILTEAIRSCTGYSDADVAAMTPDERQELARETLLDYQGGIPADEPMYRAIRKEGEADGLEAILKRYEGKYKLIKGGSGKDVPVFAEWEDADDCARWLLEQRANTLCGPFLGFYLDGQINAVGQNRWSMLKAAVRGDRWDPVPPGVPYPWEKKA